MTLQWWNEVWLNEGFASYVSYLGANHAELSWNMVRKHHSSFFYFLFVFPCVKSDEVSLSTKGIELSLVKCFSILLDNLAGSGLKMKSKSMNKKHKYVAL